MDDTQCSYRGKPVDIVHLHGLDDLIVRYDGKPEYHQPAAKKTVGQFAKYFGCQEPVQLTDQYQLTDWRMGPDTDVLAYQGCQAGARVQLWTMEDTGHMPNFDDTYFDAIWKFIK